MFLLGAAPFDADVAGSAKRLIAVSIAPLREAFASVSISFPARIHANETIVYEFDHDAFLQMLDGRFKDEVQGALELALKEGREVPVNRWCRVVALVMQQDIRFTDKITFVGIMSAVPGFDLYTRVITYLGLYAAIAILVTLIFTFLITYDIDRGFKNLAVDVSRLRVGEKLLPHKYNHGAGLVVSALNHLIGIYQKHGETSGNVLSTLVTEKIEPEMMDIPEPSFDRKRTPVDAGKPAGRTGNTDPGTAKPPAPPADVKPASPAPASAPVSTPAANGDASADPFVGLWEIYRDIKIKNGEKIADQEKVVFLAKLKTNRVSIMSKYNCRDVSFSIEEKDGKPVIKAKPVK